MFALVLPFAAALPTLSSIAHTSCSPSVNAIVGCPSGGTGTLTITGTNFYGPVASISVNVGCVTPLVLTQNVGTWTQLTCTLDAGSGTTADLVVTTQGGSTTATGFFHFLW